MLRHWDFNCHNRNLRYRILPVIGCRIEVRAAVHTAMDVHEAFAALPARIKPFACADTWRSWNIRTQLVIRLRSGIIGRHKASAPSDIRCVDAIDSKPTPFI